MSIAFHCRGIIEKEEESWNTPDSSDSVFFLLILDEFDSLLKEENYPLFVQFMKETGIEVNKSYHLCPSETSLANSDALPFLLSYPFVLCELIMSKRIKEAVRLWCDVLGCQADFCQGM